MKKNLSYLINLANPRSLIQAIFIASVAIIFNYLTLISAVIILDKRLAEVTLHSLFYPMPLAFIFYLFCVFFKKNFKSLNVCGVSVIIIIIMPYLIDTII